MKNVAWVLCNGAGGLLFMDGWCSALLYYFNAVEDLGVRSVGGVRIGTDYLSSVYGCYRTRCRFVGAGFRRIVSMNPATRKWQLLWFSLGIL